MLIGILSILTGIGIGGTIFFCVHYYRTQHILTQYEKEYGSLAELEEKITTQQEYYSQMHTSYNLSIKDKEKRLDQLRAELCRTERTYRDVQEIQKQQLIEAVAQLNTEIQSKQLSKQQLEDEIKRSNEILGSLTDNIAKMNNAVDQTAAQLEQLQQQHKKATQRLSDEFEGRIMSFNQLDIDLTNTLEGLRSAYPILSDALATLEWTKVWQTKFQAMTTDLLKQDVCGIYRIFTIENGETHSYVGQARKIRDRWSQHIKKMLGVEKIDNNKFYSAVKPWNAHFEIIEECAEIDLNTKEHYWIEYYNAIENGYNTRG